MSDNLDDLLDPGISESGNGGNSPKSLVNANAILVLGICSIVGCIFYGIPGLVCGIIALVLHQKSKEIYLSDPAAYEASYKNAKAGFICAIIGTSLSAIYFIILVIWILVAITALDTLTPNQII